MRFLARPHAGLPILGLFLLAQSLNADEALLVNSRREAGVLAVTDKGKLAFTSKKSVEPLPWTTIERIEFSKNGMAAETLTGIRRVILSGDQSLTGEFISWAKDGIRFRPTGSEALLIPSHTIEAILHPPGTLPVFEEDFRHGLDAWKTNGKPESSKLGLVLNADQSIEHPIAPRLDDGRLVVGFVIAEKPRDGRWIIEFESGGEGGQRTEQLTISIKDQRCRVQTKLGDPKGLDCKPGRHRAVIEWGPTRAMIAIDDAVLCSDARCGFGRMSAVRITCKEAEAGNPAVLFEGLRACRTVVEPRWPGGDAEQDEIWLSSGDQVFGRFVAMDHRAIVLESRGRRLKLAWTEVLGAYPRSAAEPPHALSGEWARVWLRTETAGVYDELEGVVTKLDGTWLEMRHPSLGELKFERARLHRLRRLFFGERIEVENSRHHLGDKDNGFASIIPPRAEGARLSRTFRLAEVPSTARLSVTVVQLKGAGDGIGNALDRGELRTEVWINDERVDYLNRLVDRATSKPQRLTIDVPKKFLKANENVVELRLTPEADSGQYANCGVSRLAIETEP